ncbi:MAG: hypothetical protein HOB26_05835 [Flavobacteriales bacterium]|jgi:hypothetical protein|nr:hypothetical protein [Flavobacteriales bacterium]
MTGLRSLMLVVGFLLSLFTTAQDNALIVKVHNRTGYDLDSLQICEGEYFTLSKGDVIEVVTCKSIVVIGEELAGRIIGIAVVSPVPRMIAPKGCGTGKVDSSEGRYECEIHYIKSDGKYYLDWNPLPPSPPPSIPKE